MHYQRTVELVPTTESHFEACFLSETDLSSLPMLAEVPTDIWAKSKYDVGLIKGCEPVIVTPKSDYRPCKKQYPLKPDAIKGIKPVFQSFQETGVIVPCENSPVRTPLFPVKRLEMLASQINGVL